MSDIEQAEIFLRGIVYLEGLLASYYWWEKIRHRYPEYKWDGDRITQ